MLYIAYGSNLNVDQMQGRCPDSYVFGVADLKGYKLIFKRGFLDVVKCKGGSVPIGIWEISKNDEKQLDIYEGYPRLYKKHYMEIISGGKSLQGMFYYMPDEYAPMLPSRRYYDIVAQGYSEFGFDISYLQNAFAEIKMEYKKAGFGNDTGNE